MMYVFLIDWMNECIEAKENSSFDEVQDCTYVYARVAMCSARKRRKEEKKREKKYVSLIT
jgi:hypothetical protein